MTTPQHLRGELADPSLRAAFRAARLQLRLRDVECTPDAVRSTVFCAAQTLRGDVVSQLVQAADAIEYPWRIEVRRDGAKP